MIEKPHISDEKIIFALGEHYSVPVVGVEFLPIGNDASAWAYRVDTEYQNAYFLKIRREIANQAGFLVSRYLQDYGIEQVLAPLPTKDGKLWIKVEDFFLILYPFVAGKEVMSIGMPDSQWTEFGSILKRIHVTKLPPHISQYVSRETFIPKWSSLTKELHKQVNTRNYDDPCQKELAVFWKVNNKTIQTIVERTDAISKRLQSVNLKFVLCHADIHTANILVNRVGSIYIVDWDETVFAPKERDLMFVISADSVKSKEEQLFFKGYGKVRINLLALAYYRYEWCLQEIGDFGERVFLKKDMGERTKKNSIEGFMKLFSPGDVIETAFNIPVEI